LAGRPTTVLLGWGLFGLRIVFELPEERAACLAEGLTIVAFWSLIILNGANYRALGTSPSWG
jgi:hypothetical protein